MSDLPQLPGAEGFQAVQRLMDSGFSPGEAQQYENRQMNELYAAGHHPEDIARYFGQTVPDMRKFQATVEGAYSANGPGMGMALQPKIVSDPLHMFGAGLQHSVQGLIEGRPSLEPADDVGVLGKTAYTAGQMFGDADTSIAAFAATALATKSPVAAFGAAAAVPTALRETLMDHYVHADPNAATPTFSDVWNRAAPILLDTAKAAAVGAVSGAAGGKASEIVENTAAHAWAGVANVTTQILTGDAVGAALEGRVPKWQDLVAGAASMLGLSAAGHAVGVGSRFVPSEATRAQAGRLATVYAQTGVDIPPLLQRAQTDLALHAEVAAPLAPGGERVTPLIDSLRPPEPDPYAREQVSPELPATATGEPHPNNAATPEHLALVRKLEGSADDAVSPTGAIGRYQIEPATARDYGFDPSRLTDPAYNEKAAQSILNDLSRKFDGDLPAMLVAYNAGPSRARAWIAAGRDVGMLPLETQKYLEHAERLGQIQLGANAAQVGRVLATQGDTLASSVPLGAEQAVEHEPGAALAFGAGGGAGGRGPIDPTEIENPDHVPPVGTSRIALTNEMLEDKALDIVGVPARQPGWNPGMLLKEFQSELAPARSLDSKLDTDRNSFTIEDAMRRTLGSSGVVDQFYRSGVQGIDADGNISTVTPASVNLAMQQLKEDGGTAKGFIAARLYARAIEKARQGVDTGVNLDDATLFFSRPEANAKYGRALATMAENAAGVINFARQAGILTEEGAQYIIDNNRDHIVMRRLMDPDYSPAQPGRLFGVRNPVKKMEGSDRQIVSPLIAQIDNMHTIIGNSLRNMAVGKVLEKVEAHNATAADGEKLDFTQVTDQRLDAVHHGEILQVTDQRLDAVHHGEILDENGQPVPPEMLEALKPFVAEQSLRKRLGPGDFAYYRNGQMEIWHTDDQALADLMRTPDPKVASAVADVALAVAKVHRIAIAANPLFTPLAQVHGQTMAAVVSEHGPIVPFADVVRSGMLALNGRWADAYNAWEANGGASVALGEIDKNYLQSDLQKVFERTGTLQQVWNYVKSPAQAMVNLEHMVDAASRVGAYDRLTARGYEPAKAAMLSRTAYLDHAEGFHTSWVDTMTRMATFSRVGFKDAAQLLDALQNRPGATALKGLGVLTIPVAVNYALNYLNDRALPDSRATERYSELSQYQRDNYLNLPPVNGVRMRLPLPYGSGALFGALPQRFLDFAVRHDPQAFHGIAQEMVDRFVPPVMPSILTPMLEQVTNHSFFTGRPLIPAALEHNSPQMQYLPDTSPVAKGLASVLGPAGMHVGDVSPIVVENYLNQWLGPMVGRVANALSSSWGPVGKPSTMADNPFVGSFFARQPAGSSNTISEFYDRAAEFSQAHQDFRSALQQNNPELAQQFNTAAAHLSVDRVRKALDGQRQTLNAVYQNKDMTREEKLKWTDAITTNMIEGAKIGLDLMNKAAP
jgi:Large polyvalent protein associated domain 38/Transglycosylase SLT domain